MVSGPELANLEQISCGRYLTFSFPNPCESPCPYARSLRVAILDSPIHPRPGASAGAGSGETAAMLVPLSRESDWIFSTESGHAQLLLSSPSPISRLILLGDSPNPSPLPLPYIRSSSAAGYSSEIVDLFKASLAPLFLALAPRAAFRNGELPTIPFLAYEDQVVRTTVVEVLTGPVVGDIVVEDVEMENLELRRRLRFKRMPNFVQTQVYLDPATLQPEIGSLAQPYLPSMLAGLALLTSPAARVCPRRQALCIGVGGGGLLMALHSRLGFDVVGVEVDGAILNVAKRHFGLAEGPSLKLIEADGIEFLARRGSVLADRFDVVMVDVDAGDTRKGAASAPPPEFIRLSVLRDVKFVMKGGGVVVVNVLLHQDEEFLAAMVCAFHEVFGEVYQLEIGNGENYVIMAHASSPVGLADGHGSSSRVWIDKLKLVVGVGLVDGIKRV